MIIDNLDTAIAYEYNGNHKYDTPLVAMKQNTSHIYLETIGQGIHFVLSLNLVIHTQ